MGVRRLFGGGRGRRDLARAGALRRLRPRGERPRSYLPVRVDLAAVKARVAVTAGRPRQAVALSALVLAAVGFLLGGPVGGLLAAVYAALGARAWVRRTAGRRASSARARSMDELCALAADLRAGLPPAALLEAGVGGPVSTSPQKRWVATAAGRPSAEPRTDGVADRRTAREAVAGAPERRIVELTTAVWRLAERTGAPAAELVERIEADARAADRAHASAVAQAAGAQATALLLAALPLGGIGLGYGMGVDPLEILLHTAVGGGCAIGAALLQAVGLLWADRLATGALR